MAKRAFTEPHDFDEDAQPCPCEVCGGWFDLDDGAAHPRKEGLIICEGCADDIEKEIEKEEEIEELKNQLSDAEWTVNHSKEELAKLGFKLEEKHHKMDTDTHVFFYEQDFYVLSNFSAFAVEWEGLIFPTSEHAYHYEKFKNVDHQTASRILCASSAHNAFKIAEAHKDLRRTDWDEVKTHIMKKILLEKVDQHEYVKRKLLATGDRILVEDSWRDSVWGWGPDKQGMNLLGTIWMEIRAELKAVE